MTSTPRLSPALAPLMRVAVAALLVCSAMLVTGTVVLLVMRLPAHHTATGVPASDTGFPVTAVPTVGQVSFPTPYAQMPRIPATLTLPTTLSRPVIQAIADFSIRTPESVQAGVSSMIASPLIDPDISLFAGPVDVPLDIRIPMLNVDAPVIAVGLTAANEMAAPVGSVLDDPMWQTVFWYRGSGIPGNAGTATFAGHFDDPLGRPAVFAYLGDLRAGDLIIVQDERDGRDIPFIVTETETYNEQEAANPAVMARIFGSQSADGAESQLMSDQLSHLTLITCAGTWNAGSFNQRLVVYATRAGYPL